MTEENKIIAAEIWTVINQAHHILLHCHQNADGDSVASALATAHMLEGLQKKVTVIRGDTYIPRCYHHFPGFEKIVMKTFFEVDLADIDLFIIQDSSSTERISRNGDIVFPEHLKTIIIDHHDTNNHSGGLNIIEPTYPSTTSILYELFMSWHVPINRDIALCLFLGLYDDTGGFQYAPTNNTTFKMAAELVSIVPDYHEAVMKLNNMVEPEQLEFIKLAYNCVEHYFSGKLALSAVSHAALQAKGILKRHTTGVNMSNKLRAVVGWDLDITMIEYDPGEIGLSLRTREEEVYDLTKITVPLGGGGHKAAGGAFLKMEFGEAKKLLLDTIQRAYPQLGNP